MSGAIDPRGSSGAPLFALEGHRERFERLRNGADPEAVWVCPPQWDLGPRAYRDLLGAAFEDPEPLMEVAEPAIRAGGGALAVLITPVALSYFDLPESVQTALAGWGFPIGVLLLTLCLLFCGGYTVGAVRYVRDQRVEQAAARERLAALDAEQVLTLSRTSGSDLDEFESCMDAVIESPAVFSEDRRAVLAGLYEAALDGGPEAYETALDTAVDVLDRDAPAALSAAETRLANLVGRGAGQRVLGDPTTPSAETVTGASRWADPVARHDEVIEAWTAMVTDPLNALTHAALFDVTQPRTAAFIEAYGAVQDFRSVHGITDLGPSPHDGPGSGAGASAGVVEEMLIDYVSLVRRATSAWDEAKRYSQRIGWDWLPDREATAARKAAGLLALAADESATFHERAAAAAKAQALLREVSTFMLPEATCAALEAQTRLSIEPA